MITVALARVGTTTTALDRSPAKIARLRKRAAGIANLAVVYSDITALPFADRMFRSVLVPNVFHLIAAWERALGELGRALDRNGILLVNLGGAGDMPPELARLTEHFCVQLGPPGQVSRPAIGPERVIQRLADNVFARPGMAQEARAAASVSRD